MTTPEEVNLTHKPVRAEDGGSAAFLQDAHDAAIGTRALPTWCITFDPRDLPGLYVARLNVSASARTLPLEVRAVRVSPEAT